MRVTFVLPGFASHPVGGVLVVYRYSEELSRRGHLVSVIHPRLLDAASTNIERWKTLMWPHKVRLLNRGRSPAWYPLSSSVRSLLVPHLDEAQIPDADVVFATAYETAAPVANWDQTKGHKFYLIQHFEDWGRTAAEVDASWRLPMHKVLIARWLYEHAAELGETASSSYIPNGVEHSLFQCVRPTHDRPLRVGMLVHPADFKGTADGLEAVCLVRAALCDLRMVAFGTTPRPNYLPSWVDYVENPSRTALAHLYNSIAVFVHPSWSEGWGLPAAEAMACGAALAATANGGVRDYAVHQESALLSPVRDPRALAGSILRLLNDQDLRLRIAERGRHSVARFTWERSAEEMHRIISSVPVSRC